MTFKESNTLPWALIPELWPTRSPPKNWPSAVDIPGAWEPEEYLLARKAAEEEKGVIRKHLEGVDLVFLLAGRRRNRRWRRARHRPSRLRMRSPRLCLCPLPFSWEKGRHAQAEECLAELRKHANAVVPLPNDSLLQVGGPDATRLGMFCQSRPASAKGFRPSARWSFAEA